MRRKAFSPESLRLIDAESSHFWREGGYHVPAELELSGLETRVFEAFANTSNRRYLYLCNMRTNVSRWSRSAVEYFGLPGEYIYDAGNVWA